MSSSCASCGQPEQREALIVQDPRKLLIVNNASGPYTVTYPYVKFTGTAPSPVSWSGMDQFTIINGTNSVLTLGAGYYYVDINGATQTTIPALSTVQIKKSNQGIFEQINEDASGGGGGSLTGNL